ncbi:aminotransferase class I/II-fold pyridoxal phosphate-dependent enzyme [Lutimonas halocynthiae]|uniref:DegT/DnrJ/EryC1/StrS family aminotransferase n=1 Tax=Lutimonas halocynthiae TaxID=1446477 RepID=UPI0025B4E64E|nr:aminotransferase class I/II-fold pyridoxal phosphate-dependent enzyme [Lutimonas halocynthiae]MDN3643800.1 aminotransferase class I/II-fold pyridoxal phosphate-dependent enzyme [Lutimonas halocynthiae]
MKEKIWLSSPHLTGEEQKYIKEAFDTNWVAPLGPNVNGLEADICAYSQVKSCSALTSGTSAIHLALILLGVEADDEVLVSSFTFSATINPIRYQKAIPVLIDSEKDTWNMSPELLEQAIQDRIAKGKTPKAIILVHLYGMPSKMDELIGIANKYKIPIIEDAAEAIGASYKGRPMGGFGELGVFSFNGNKIITTSGGGALVSNNPDYCKKATFLATQARDEAPHYQHSQIGYNYRMSNIVAGIGRGQIEVLDDRVAARRKNFEFYKKELGDIPTISFVEEPDGFFSNRWLTTILTDSFETRERIRLVLEKENIESRPLWKPMHLQPVFEEFPAYTDGTSEDLFNRGLCLPSGSNLSLEDLRRVVGIIKEVLRTKY